MFSTTYTPDNKPKAYFYFWTYFWVGLFLGGLTFVWPNFLEFFCFCFVYQTVGPIFGKLILTIIIFSDKKDT